MKVPLGYVRANGAGEIVFSQCHPGNLDIDSWTWHPVYIDDTPNPVTPANLSEHIAAWEGT